MSLSEKQSYPQTHTDVIQGYIRNVETLFPSDNPYYHIIENIKQKILEYYFERFQSNLLDSNESNKFSNLLIKHNKTIGNYPWKLLLSGKTDKVDY